MKNNYNLEVQGIILKKTIYGDTSLILEILCKEVGKISVLARGIRKGKSKFSGLFESGNRVELLLSKKNSSDFYYFKNGTLINAYLFSLGYPRNLLLYAALEICHQLLISEDEAENIYSLLLTYFEYLQKQAENEIAIFWRFLLRLFIVTGIELNLRRCTFCHLDSSNMVAYYSLRHGFICEKCFQNHLDEFVINFSFQTAGIIHILPEIGNHLKNLSISSKTAREVTKILLLHLSEQFHKKFYCKSIDYYFENLYHKIKLK
ncbi:MAG: DNA repair protein RecO [Candidatus Cloacimonetes bacterium]|nr:DNA repair protein RecO [Candidatus Cloacimonadota bacterium]